MADETKSKKREATEKVEGAAEDTKESATRSRPEGASGGEGWSKLRWLALPVALVGGAGAAAYALAKTSGGEGRGNGARQDDEGLLDRGKQAVAGAVAQVRDAGGVREAATDAVSKVRDVVQSQVGGEEGGEGRTKAANGGREDDRPRRDPSELEAARRERQQRREERRKRARR